MRALSALATVLLLAACVPKQPLSDQRELAPPRGHRPYAWCGWWMRHQVAVDPGPAANLARWWAHYGAPAAGPAPGVIVVWGRRGIHGHVGLIVGPAENGQWLVRSGNDRHAVRTRARSVAGALAFRWPQ